MLDDWIVPQWPAAAHIKAVSTTRLGGVSQAPWDSLNLGAHVDDRARDVASNRHLLQTHAGLPQAPVWLEQIHSAKVVHAEQGKTSPTADAMVAHSPGLVCAVMTADCLPVLFSDRQGQCVAAAHAGWRGLQAGVLENTVAALEVPPATVLAWLGPAIGPSAFEVGEEVREAFIAQHALATRAFQATANKGKWLADIYALARLRLQEIGVTEISGGSHCTYTDAARFFSYRRDGQTGRMASAIWIDENSRNAQFHSNFNPSNSVTTS